MEVSSLTEVGQLKLRFQIQINLVPILSQWTLTNIPPLVTVDMYDFIPLFRVPPGSCLARFPGCLNDYVLWVFLMCLVFFCLLCGWLNNNVTECEEIAYLCAYVCLVLFDSWFAAVCLKDLWVSGYMCIREVTLWILQYVFLLILDLLT